jgi:multicomponent Na+:H+ antiporter subunit E
VTRTPVTVTEALDLLAADEYTANFELVDGALCTSGSDAVCALERAAVARPYRFEGPSDPADQMTAFGLRDPRSGTRGTHPDDSICGSARPPRVLVAAASRPVRVGSTVATSGGPPMRSLGYIVALAAIWVLLWGSASPANVLSGLAVGFALVLAIPDLRPRTKVRVGVRPLAISRLVGYVLVATIRANVELTKEVIARKSRVRTAVIGVPLPGCSDELLTLISNLLALSPGTMPLELRQQPTVLYIHALLFSDVEQVRRDVLHLTDLAVRAFGTNETIAEQRAYMQARKTP